MRALVRKNDAKLSYERWEVRWSDGHVIAGLPTRARAYGFADLVTALVPLEREMQEIRARLDSCERWAREDERQSSTGRKPKLKGKKPRRKPKPKVQPAI